mmetsp:Transcript_6692/g.18896  ORF Transcript_6692/g.18896 Transcript_6692/m.18896 type:complete len:315 (+) Transcript_6692:1898-2842(+)
MRPTLPLELTSCQAPLALCPTWATAPGSSGAPSGPSGPISASSAPCRWPSRTCTPWTRSSATPRWRPARPPQRPTASRGRCTRWSWSSRPRGAGPTTSRPRARWAARCCCRCARSCGRTWALRPRPRRPSWTSATPTPSSASTSSTPRSSWRRPTASPTSRQNRHPRSQALTLQSVYGCSGGDHGFEQLCMDTSCRSQRWQGQCAYASGGWARRCLLATTSSWSTSLPRSSCSPPPSRPRPARTWASAGSAGSCSPSTGSTSPSSWTLTGSSRRRSAWPCAGPSRRGTPRAATPRPSGSAPAWTPTACSCRGPP